MRLREERIEAIALAVTDSLAEEELVDLLMDEEDLSDLIVEAISKDLAIEDQIQEEAVRWIRDHKKHLEEGTHAWSIEIEQKRDQIAITRNYLLP